MAFEPGHARYRRRLWVRFTRTDGVFYHVYWRRVAVLAGVLAVLAWLGLAAAAWGFVKYRRGVTQVRYLDLAFYPLRQEHYRTCLGQHYQAEGRAAFQRQDYSAGYALLNASVARMPRDLTARRELAVADIAFGRVDRALRVLHDGLPFGRHDLDYLKLLFGLLLEAHEDDRLVALAKEFLPPQPDQALLHRFVALQAATAHYHRGRAEQAERLVADWQLEKTIEGQILLARCDWDRGLRDRALLRLEQQVATFPKRDELYLELVRLHRAAGHAAESRRYALLRQFNDPTSPGPRIDLLHSYRAAADPAAETRELEAYLKAFAGDAKALLLLAGFAVDTLQPALAERVAAIALAQKLPPQPFDLARVQAALAARDYRTANALAEAALRTAPSGQAYAVALFNAERAVALFGLEETAHAQGLLTSFLDNTRVRASDALLLARQLQTAKQPDQARRVLARAVQADPLNQPALAELIRLDAERGDRTAVAQNLPALLAMRKQSQPVLEDILRRLNEPEDETLRAQIRAALARKP